jgi:ABC-type transport system involved in multi-copper enzyme maturation permease subunit
MKYLAILKDSLYEALDTKVFYVMVGLSCLVLLIVGSVSYAPISIEAEAERLAQTLTWGMQMEAKDADPLPTVAIADFTQTNPDSPPYERDYRFTVIVRHAVPGKVMPVQFIVPAAFSAYLKGVKVTQVDSPDPTEQHFAFRSEGSRVTQLRDWPHEPTLFFTVPVRFLHLPLGSFVYFFENTLINNIGAGVTLLISVIITAFFIPNMLRKGTVDLLLVKPIHRSTLLVYKYIGGLAFMFLNTSFVVVGVWLILGLRTDIWGVGFLASIPVLTFQFALYYAVSTLAGVVTRSSIVAILLACLAWFVFALVIGQAYGVIDSIRKGIIGPRGQVVIEDEGHEAPPTARLPEWVYTTADIVHWVTPRLKDLDNLTNKLILDDTLPEFSSDRRLADRLFATFRWSEALSVTTIYIVVLLALSCWWFATKDY